MFDLCAHIGFIRLVQCTLFVVGSYAFNRRFNISHFFSGYVKYMSKAYKERMICMETYQVRTDLAVEAKDMYIEKQGKSKDSVKGVTVKDRWENNIKISHVDITSEGSELINKKP